MNAIFAQLDSIGAHTADALEFFMGDEEMYMKYVRQFPDEPSMGIFVAAMDSQDYDTAEKAVHAMKGIVQSLGFVPLTDAATKTLLALCNGDIAGATEAYGNVRTQYKRYCDVITAWREES